MAPTFTLLTDGTCSFCGSSRREARAFVGASIMDVRICDDCLGFCWGVLAKIAGATDDIETQSAVDVPEEQLASVLATLAKQGVPARGQLDPEFRCSFCY